MTVKINNELQIDITEDCLIVKDGKLFNTKTKEYEGVEGDIIEFITAADGVRVWHRGIVEGYTYCEKIKLRGKDTSKYENVTKKLIEHISNVVCNEDENFDDEELLAATGAMN